MKIKLDEIIDALEFVNDSVDSDVFLEPETMKIFYVSENTPFEDKEYIYENCFSLPTKYDIDEYSMMESFIETIDDVRLYNQLQIAINGRGAFRRFKDTCINFDIIEDWYKYRDEKYKELAIEWCKDSNIDFE